jgi:hypothetical protein
MGDRWRDPTGREIVAFDQARFAVLTNIVEYVRDAKDPQEVVVVKLSEPEKYRDFKGLNDQTQQEIEDYVKNRSAVKDFHFDLLPALRVARTLIDDAKKMNLVLHVVSDFRAADWNDRTKDALGEQFEYFQKAKVVVKLHDVAPPPRPVDEGKPLISNDNLALIEFRPESRVVVKDTPIEFTVKVANHSNSDKTQVRVNVRVNNEEKRDGSVNIPLIRARDTVTARVTFSLSRTAPKDAGAAGGEAADLRRFDGFNLVSAHIENETEGLAVDNVRYAFVEVREKVPMLLVDNNVTGRDDRGKPTKQMECFYLWKLFNDTYRGFDVSVRTAADLEKINLQNFSAIILCDIPQLTPKAVQKLEAFAEGGGGVGFFMGASVRDPKFYNDVLYKDGKGLFPAPLKEVANKNMTPEQLNQYLLDQLVSFNKKLLVRAETRRHPAMEKLYTDSRGQSFNDLSYESIFYLVTFAKYYIVDRPKWKHGDNVQTLLYLPNNRAVGDYARQVNDLMRKLKEATNPTARAAALQEKIAATMDEARKKELMAQLAAAQADTQKYDRYQKVLKDYADLVSNTIGRENVPLPTLVGYLERLLESPGDDKANPPVPSMLQFWQAPELADLRGEFQNLLDTMKYGDPFYIAKQYGKGRVLAFMGAAGASGPEGDLWNPLNKPGREYFPPLMKDSLQRYLCSTGGDFFLPLGKPFDFELDSSAYETKNVHTWLAQGNDRPAVDESKVKFQDLGAAEMREDGAAYKWTFPGGEKPGMYLFEFSPKAPEGNKKDFRPDVRAVSYNFDGEYESDLTRARSEDLKGIARVEKVETVDQKVPPKKLAKETLIVYPPEVKDLGLSKSQWLYLGMLVILILEQAWAVRLSFHVRNSASSIIPQGMGRAAATA